jgi:hypothetical protein
MSDGHPVSGRRNCLLFLVGHGSFSFLCLYARLFSLMSLLLRFGKNPAILSAHHRHHHHNLRDGRGPVCCLLVDAAVRHRPCLYELACIIIILCTTKIISNGFFSSNPETFSGSANTE